MTITEARRILIDQMKRDGTYDEVVADLEHLITRAQTMRADVPGHGRVSAWDLAMELAVDGDHAVGNARALVAHFPLSFSDAVVLAANAMGRTLD